MKYEIIGYWTTESYCLYSLGDKEICITEDGGLFLQDVPQIDAWLRKSRKVDPVAIKTELSKRYFSREDFLRNNDYSYMTKILKAFDGKSEAEIKEIAAGIEKKRAEKQDQADWAKWEKLREKFGGYVIGMEKTADIYDAGFSVRVLMKTEVPFPERRRFLRENQKDFLLWAINEIKERPKIMRKIGDIRFYNPVEIINLKIPEVEIKFEVKGELVNA